VLQERDAGRVEVEVQLGALRAPTGGQVFQQPQPQLFLRRLTDEAEHTAVGIVAREDWTTHDWQLVQGSGWHVFLNQRELAAGLGAPGDAEAAHLLSRLRSLGDGFRVTATLGAVGAMLLGPGPHLTHVPAPAVTAARLGGDGDVYCTTMMQATALGRPPGVAAALAAMDAARWVSGRSPAATLAELEEEVRRRPEMTERIVPFPGRAA
jgi:sugar/nucleoside kinase (ribokinase family)